MITFDGVEINSYATITDVRRPLIAPQRLSTVTIEGRHGSYFYNKVSDSFNIEVDMTLKGESPIGLRNKIRDLIGVLDTSEPKPLVIEDEPDKYINAILADESSLETLFRVGQATVNFYVPDPFYYAIEDDIHSYTTTGVKHFNRKGNTESYPTIEIEGTGGFRVVTDNADMVYTGGLLSGEKLVIDSELLTAYVIKTNGEQVSALNDLNNLEFPVLVKGANSINVIPQGNAVLNSYKVTSNSRWK